MPVFITYLNYRARVSIFVSFVLTRPVRWPFSWAQILSRDFHSIAPWPLRPVSRACFPVRPTPHQHVPSILIDSLNVWSHINHTWDDQGAVGRVRGAPSESWSSAHTKSRSWLNMKINSQWIKAQINPRVSRMGLLHSSYSQSPPLQSWPPSNSSLPPSILQTPREMRFIPNLMLGNTVVINSSALAALYLETDGNTIMPRPCGGVEQEKINKGVALSVKGPKHQLQVSQKTTEQLKPASETQGSPPPPVPTGQALSHTRCGRLYVCTQLFSPHPAEQCIWPAPT